MKITGFVILTVFYAVYTGKMLLKRKGIQTDQIAKGKQKTKLYYTELTMKAATYSVAAAEVLSLLFAPAYLPKAFAAAGVVLGVTGDILFTVQNTAPAKAGYEDIRDGNNRYGTAAGKWSSAFLYKPYKIKSC